MEIVMFGKTVVFVDKKNSGKKENNLGMRASETA